MSYSTHTGNYGPEGGAKTTKGGTMLLAETIEQCHSSVSQILSTLSEIENRLYSPRPSPVPGKIDGSSPSSLEGAANGLLSRLREVETLASRLLHG